MVNHSTKAHLHKQVLSRGHQLFEISYTCFEILLEIQEITEFKILSQETIQNQEPWERSQTNQELYESSQVNLYYRIQLYVRSRIKPVVGKKPHKPGAV